MKTKKLLIVFVLSLFALSACAKAAATEMPMTAYDMSNTAGRQEDSFAAAPEAAYEAPKGEYSQTSSEVIQQMVIKNADLLIAVDDPAVSMSDISKMATNMGGFVVSSYIYKSQTSTGLEVPEATIAIRVPAEKLDQALDEIKNLTGDPVKYALNESISGQDVTQEYTDLKSRLKNLEEANVKLTELYDLAENAEDALAVYNQKIYITEQIEVIKGQMQYYEQASAKSSISVRIVAKETIAPVTIAGWQPKGVARDAVQALINFGKGFVEFLIWLVILVVPVVVIIGAPIYFLVRWLVRRNRRKAAERQDALRKAMAGQKPPEMK